MKYPKLVYGFIAILGTISLSILFAALYSNVFSLDNMLTSLPTMPIFWISMLGGTILLTVGMLGIGRQCFKDENKRGPFTLITVFLIPLVILLLINYVNSMITIT